MVPAALMQYLSRYPILRPCYTKASEEIPHILLFWGTCFSVPQKGSN